MSELQEYRFKTKPFQHQLDGWNRSKDCRYYGLLMEMGTGKTKIIIDTMAYLYDKGIIDAAMVFSNKGSYMNWINTEVPIHMPEHIRYSAFAWRSEGGKKFLEELHEFIVKPFIGLKIFVMNVEGLAYDRSFKVAENFVAAHATLTVIDESSTIKHITSKRTKSAMKLRDISKARRIMTGSAVTNSPLDVYAQMEFLQKGILGFSNFFSFKSYFAELIEMRVNQRSFQKIVGYRNLDKLTQLLSKWNFICKKEDCLDLPPKVYEVYNIELTDEQKRMYESMRKQAMIELENEQLVTAKLVLIKLLRLHQLVCGFVQIDETKETRPVENARITALLDILEEIQGKVLIWATYRYNIKQIYEKLSEVYGPESVAHYFGDTTTDEREKAKAGIQTGKVRFLVGNPRTAGYGLTLTAATTSIYFSNNWDFDVRDQSESRNHRVGTTSSITYIDFCAKGTIDEKILKSLKDKKSMANQIVVSNWKEYF